jgi:Mn2+/Fe2+ NRAMP family transporter
MAAGLSSLFPNLILGPWMLTDFLGRPREMTRPVWRALVAATSCFALVVPVFGGSPVGIMIASQAVSPLIMPLMVLCTWIVLARSGAPAGHRNSVWMHAGLAVTLVATVYMAGVAAVGFRGAIR